jgi:hypothetical protein
MTQEYRNERKQLKNIILDRSRETDPIPEAIFS